MKKLPKGYETVEKLISLDGRIKLESTTMFKENKKYYLLRYGWYGQYETLFYHIGADEFCIYDEKTDSYQDLDIKTAYDYAVKELEGGN